MTAFYNRISRSYVDREDELIAAAAKIRDTMQSPGWGLLWEYIDQSREQALARLIQSHAGDAGRSLDHADYVRLTAYLAGVEEPQTVAQAFQQAAENVRNPE